MGASLTSPLPHRPPTSVCNHLFVAPDAPPIFRHHPLTTVQTKKQSVFTTGWNWSKKTAQQVNFIFFYFSFFFFFRISRFFISKNY